MWETDECKLAAAVGTARRRVDGEGITHGGEKLRGAPTENNSTPRKGREKGPQGACPTTGTKNARLPQEAGEKILSLRKNENILFYGHGCVIFLYAVILCCRG